MSNIQNIEDVGEEECCDLEVDHPDHQFYLANGVLTSNSHAVAYAIDSYWCAWLMTYHEEEWLTAYMESMSNSEDKRAKAFSEVKALGYQIVPIDINYAEAGWTVLPGKKLMPSFLSCKGVGASAITEIMRHRPYTTIEDMLWNEDGTWKHSKFNKKAFEALVKIGAFESMDLIGEGKVFSSYRHMHEVIIENQDLIKKTSKKDPYIGKKNFYELVRGTRDTVEEWTRKELAEFKVEYFGSLDVLTMIDPVMLENLEKKGVIPIDDLEQGQTQICWFVIAGGTLKKTKNGKQYLQLQVLGPVGKSHRMNVWGWKDGMTFDEYELCFAEVKRDDFGCSTMSWKLKSIG